MSTEQLPFPGLRSGVEDVVPTDDGPQTAKEYTSDQEVRWCPGCGDYAVLKAVQGFLPELGLRRENIVFVSGIGCSLAVPLLHRHLRHALHPRPRALHRHRHRHRPRRPLGVGRHRRRRRTLHRRQPPHPRPAPQREHDHPAVQQPHLRPHQGPVLPHLEAGKVTKSTPMGSRRPPLQPRLPRARRRSTTSSPAPSTPTASTSPPCSPPPPPTAAPAWSRSTKNCPIFNDGAFDAIKNNDTKADAIIPSIHGEPITFSAGTKGLIRDHHHRRRQDRRDHRRRHRRPPDPRRPQPRPLPGLRDHPTHRHGLPQPDPHRHLPPSRPPHLRRPGPRPGRHRHRRHPRHPHPTPRQPHQQRRHLDRGLDPAPTNDAPAPRWCRGVVRSSSSAARAAAGGVDLVGAGGTVLRRALDRPLVEPGRPGAARELDPHREAALRSARTRFQVRQALCGPTLRLMITTLREPSGVTRPLMNQALPRRTLRSLSRRGSLARAATGATGARAVAAPAERPSRRTRRPTARPGSASAPGGRGRAGRPGDVACAWDECSPRGQTKDGHRIPCPLRGRSKLGTASHRPDPMLSRWSRVAGWGWESRRTSSGARSPCTSPSWSRPGPWRSWPTGWSWSALTMGLLVLLLRRTTQLRAVVRNRRTFLLLAGAGAIITVNWATYIWGVTHDRVVETVARLLHQPLVSGADGRADPRGAAAPCSGSRWASRPPPSAC